MPVSGLANLGAARAGRQFADLEFELLNALSDAVIATDTEGSIIFWNRAAEGLYGWTADEVVGRNILDVTPSEDSQKAAAAIFEKLTKGERWSGEFETRHKDGSRVLIEVTDSPVRDQQGRLVAIVGNSRPIEREAPAPAGAEGDADPQTLGRALNSVRSSLRSLANDAERPGRLRGWAIAVLLYGLALATRVALDRLIPGELSFIGFFPAILMAAYICGFWPTVALLIASGVTGAAWGRPGIEAVDAHRVFAAGLFILIGGITIAPMIYASDARRRLRLNEEHLLMVNSELKHRVKNLFAVTSSICVQTIRSGVPREAMAAAIAGRIQAIAAAQDLVGATDEEGSDLLALVEAVVRPLSPDATRLAIGGPSVTLPVDATISFALVLHELATNAVKYGAWAAERGRTVIRWQLVGERQLEFRWREEGVALSAAPTREGFGSVLIRRAISQASVRHEFGADGVDCRIEMALG